MYLLGFDIGSSSIKASLVNGDSGKCEGSAFYPRQEMTIDTPLPEWAEQDPEKWWSNLKLAVKDVLHQSKADPAAIEAIGISYQMHGLVLVDKNQKVLRPAIIWCDSRATPYGDQAMKDLGAQTCLSHLLNSPGNFTASKLKWVRENEPDVFSKIDKVMLPGDFIAMKLSGVPQTTASGLSEGIFWDFRENNLSAMMMDYYGFSKSIIPEIVPTFSVQSEVSAEAARELGLRKGIKISYRAGDQPNNALSLNVLNPGEIATTAGTSGVVYGVSDEIKYDSKSRVNTFLHVNHTQTNPRLGVLLCINGTGILNSWLNRKLTGGMYSYEQMNELAARVPAGSQGLSILPFGNGSERVLENQNPGATISGLNFNIHSHGHIFRAAQEGIVFSFRYGMEVMESIGIHPSVIRAGKANMFLSPVFRETLANISGASIELYNTDGSVGAARGAGIGSGYYKSPQEAFHNLTKLQTIIPDPKIQEATLEAYEKWKLNLNRAIK